MPGRFLAAVDPRPDARYDYLALRLVCRFRCDRHHYLEGVSMNPLGVVLILAAELAVVILTLLAFHERGRRHGVKEGAKDGYDKGYAQGRKDADNWWIGLETEADKVRQQIWREEAQP
jgi:hypothetical protein